MTSRRRWSTSISGSNLQEKEIFYCRTKVFEYKGEWLNDIRLRMGFYFFTIEVPIIFYYEKIREMEGGCDKWLPILNFWNRSFQFLPTSVVWQNNIVIPIRIRV